MTVGGVNLKALGVQPLDSQSLRIVKNVDNAHLVLQGNLVTLEVQGEPALKLDWNAASRKIVTDLAAKYGYAATPEVMARAEEWISSLTIDATARYTSEMSKPLVIRLSKAIWVELGADGQVTVEKAPVPFKLEPSVMQVLKQGGAQNATLCWNNGALEAQVDGKPLPSVILDPKAAPLFSKIVGSDLQKSLDMLYNSLIGADITLPGGSHQANFTCGQ